MENKRGDLASAETYLGQEVARLRKERDLTQAELAEHLGAYGFTMHQVTVAKLESAQRPIRVNEAVALAQILGVPISVLIPDRGELLAKGDEMTAAVYDLNRAQARMVAAAALLDEAQREEATQAARVEQYRAEWETARATVAQMFEAFQELKNRG